ncbi:hypothetical protein BD410DRAFT_900034 [Rickenella mellea]|uniref:RNA polymerase II-associated protein 1 C-terminal domain-containing protein n=1 Tax=Rickenella mellea TaxID=50990 RepID=A0A4Y7PYL7_9AGAM|nr:hypothetical protein BD410DRAFT_900034 [Rickenella mellea]
MSSPLVGNVLERNISPRPPTRFVNASQESQNTGFPSVQHRSKSAFARAREARRKPTFESQRDVPIVQPVAGPSSARISRDSPGFSIDSSRPGVEDVSEKWRDQMSEENVRRVESMTDAERQEERTEILEKFGPNIGDVLRKAREARERNSKRLHLASDVKHPIPTRALHEPQSPHSPTPRGILVVTPPTSRASTPGRRIRFAEVTPDDVHVFQSEPPTPKRVLGLLLPPGPDDDGTPVVKIPGMVKIPQNDNAEGAPPPPDTAPSAAVPADMETPRPDVVEEGTPEDIRRRFFPNAPEHDPTLEWIQQRNANPEPDDTTSPRFDLSGRVITIDQQTALPTHLGLHHHSSSAAGYTLDDLLLLSRSTVPAQRATMIGVLSKIVRRVAKGSAPELRGREEEVRKRALAAGLEAFEQRGSLGVQAIELTWVCLVFWDERFADIEGVELCAPKPEASPAAANTSMDTSDSEVVSGQTTLSTDPIDTLPLSYLLPQIAAHINQASVPRESLSQLLDILYRLTRHSNDIATQVVQGPNMVASIVMTFIATPIPPTESTPLPTPFAIRLLRVMAMSSRENARALAGASDALLRFVTSLPSSSPFPLPLATALLTATLELYSTLASYGLYSQTATTAAPYFTALGSYITSPQCSSGELTHAWLRLMESWMVCATDPHQTTPPHDILWSQVLGWGWYDDLMALWQKMVTTPEEWDVAVWSSLWRALSAWLEGCKVNSIKNGQDERRAVIERLRESLSSGVEKAILTSAVDGVRSVLSVHVSHGASANGCSLSLRHGELSDSAEYSQSFLRLTLACSYQGNAQPEIAPWVEILLPVVTDAWKAVVYHRMWTAPFDPLQITYLRPLTSFVAKFARMHSPPSGTETDEDTGTALIALQRLVAGDEEAALIIIDDTVKRIARHGVTDEPPTPLENFDVLSPFLSYAVRPNRDVYLGPWSPSPASIRRATTQTLPPTWTRPWNGISGLPLPRDWPVAALDHLLRSGSSAVFQDMPNSWDASETDVVRASLTLASRVRDVLVKTGQISFSMSREQTILACMKVFMLEHGQQQNDSAEEVFRDNVVGKLMEGLLEPFAFSSRSHKFVKENIEDAAKAFLGPSTPFFQFYTDFVGLYDAISFSHRLFALLLLPPTSMDYPIDYRKHLWGDYGHLLRALHMPIEQILTDDVGSYLWPVERDPDMLGSYLRALVKWPLDGFVRLVAIHHVACNIWPDLRTGDDVSPDRAKMLLRAVVEQGKEDAVKDVLRYRQRAGGEVALPPICFQGAGEWKQSRLGCVLEWGGESLKDRLEKIFLDAK